MTKHKLLGVQSYQVRIMTILYVYARRTSVCFYCFNNPTIMIQQHHTWQSCRNLKGSVIAFCTYLLGDTRCVLCFLLSTSYHVEVRNMALTFGPMQLWGGEKIVKTRRIRKCLRSTIQSIAPSYIWLVHDLGRGHCCFNYFTYGSRGPGSAWRREYMMHFFNGILYWSFVIFSPTTFFSYRASHLITSTCLTSSQMQGRQ